MKKQNRVEELKKLAMQSAGITSLPKRHTGAFTGLAVLKVLKYGNKESWTIGRHDLNLNKVLITEDFDGRMMDKVLEIYPYQMGKKSNTASTMTELQKKKAKLTAFGYDDIKMWTEKLCDAELGKITEAQERLRELGTENVEDATLSVLTEKIKELEKAAEGK